jgi:sulfur carrier protein ThiS
MTEIVVQVEWKLPQLPRQKSQLTIPPDTTVRDLLRLCATAIDEKEVVVAVNGKAALLDDVIPSGSSIILLPVLCGG